MGGAKMDKVGLSVEQNGRNYHKFTELPIIPRRGTIILLWVYCDHYRFAVERVLQNNGPEAYSTLVIAKAMPAEEQEPLQFEKDPEWGK